MEKLQQKEETVTHNVYDVNGKEYVAAERAFYADRSDPTHTFFMEVLSGNLDGKVLADIGSGAGDELLGYAEAGAAKVFGIEPSVTMRTIAEKSLKGLELPVEVLDGNFTALPFEDESIDFVTARYSLHIISDFEKAFAEVARVLKQDGLFLTAVSHPDYDARVAAKQGKQIGERVEIPLFAGGTVVENATHTMEEYLGETAQKYFVCEKKFEYGMGGDPAKLTDLVLLYRKR